MLKPSVVAWLALVAIVVHQWADRIRHERMVERVAGLEEKLEK